MRSRDRIHLPVITFTFFIAVTLSDFFGWLVRDNKLVTPRMVPTASPNSELNCWLQTDDYKEVMLERKTLLQVLIFFLMLAHFIWGLFFTSRLTFEIKNLYLCWHLCWWPLSRLLWLKGSFANSSWLKFAHCCTHWLSEILKPEKNVEQQTHKTFIDINAPPRFLFFTAQKLWRRCDVMTDLVSESLAPAQQV